jgi:hypothetical protein
MRTYQIGYFVGSLSSTSINRELSKALIRLAPKTSSSPRSRSAVLVGGWTVKGDDSMRVAWNDGRLRHTGGSINGPTPVG